MKVITVVGARPQVVKAAAFERALMAGPGQDRIEHHLVHTGQHYDFNMSELLFQQLRLPAPKYNLGVGSGAHGAQTGEILRLLEPVLEAEKPDVVLVYGDTNSTLGAALCASKLHIPIAHIEAGLRSYNRRMPEEINRVVTDHVSDFLLCPSNRAVQNLDAEGIRKGVANVGDVMYDILLLVQAEMGLHIDAETRRSGEQFALATVHRAENTDDSDRLREIVAALSEVAARGLRVVWPVHPRVRSLLGATSMHEDVSLVEPVGYVEMVGLLSRCSVVVTDSGGLQKEAMWSGAPCVTMRDETEWEETIELGWNRLVPPDRVSIAIAVLEALPPRDAIPDVYGMGRAADNIVKYLLDTEMSRNG